MTHREPVVRLLGSPVHATSHARAAARILDWAGRRESRMVCFADIHVLMRAFDAAGYRALLEGADLVCPDGMPLVWSLRRRGAPGQERVAGPDFTLTICRAARDAGIPIGIHGGRPEVVQALTRVLPARFPGLEIAYAASPPFRPLAREEEDAVVDEINASGARILLVGLGCPKQELWMAAHRGRVRTVMLGVGAAFDFHAGRVRRAPRIMQEAGLEWLFRLAMEPRRLWRRYAQHGPRFAALMSLELASASWRRP